MNEKLIKRAAAAVLSLALAAAAVPAAAGNADAFGAAATEASVCGMNGAAKAAADLYDSNDYGRLRAFLESTDFYGVKNGIRLNPNYDPDDPATWNADAERPNMVWTDSGSAGRRIVSINISGLGLCGSLDLSGCAQLTELNADINMITDINLDGCTALQRLLCSTNRLVGLSAGDSKHLRELGCSDNYISTLDVTGNPELEALACAMNPIESLDLSGNPALKILDCRNCALTELDLTAAPLIKADSIRAVGNGFIGIKQDYDNDIADTVLWAMPFVDVEFVGWYTLEGSMVSDEMLFKITDESGELILNGGGFFARFGGGTTGDSDGDGSITVGDALIALRDAMDLLEPDAARRLAADVDGDGSVTVTDALAIIRVAMGIASF